MRYLKRVFLRVSKVVGLFHLARRVTARGLRIICYHGIALADEARFRPQLFVSPATFGRRLRCLSAGGFPVLPLDGALDALDKGNLPACPTVITIDDGFYSVYTHGLQPLRRFSFPATLYVTTYYALKETPVFRLAVQYMFWKTGRAEADLSALNIASLGRLSLTDARQREQDMWRIIHYGETQCSEVERGALARTLGACLAVDYQHIVDLRSLTLVNATELREMAANGIDVQLHTHRHSFPDNEVAATQEILENKAALEPLVGKALTHFCYPSGKWSRDQWSWLATAGIRSATTCEPGLNYAETPRFALSRFLDGEHISQIEFEAEIFGYAELLRRSRAWFKRVSFREGIRR